MRIEVSNNVSPESFMAWRLPITAATRYCEIQQAAWTDAIESAFPGIDIDVSVKVAEPVSDIPGYLIHAITDLEFTRIHDIERTLQAILNRTEWASFCDSYTDPEERTA